MCCIVSNIKVDNFNAFIVISYVADGGTGTEEQCTQSMSNNQNLGRITAIIPCISLNTVSINYVEIANLTKALKPILLDTCCMFHWFILYKLQPI